MKRSTARRSADQDKSPGTEAVVAQATTQPGAEADSIATAEDETRMEAPAEAAVETATPMAAEDTHNPGPADTIEPTSPNHTGMEKIMKSTEDFIAFGQGNVEAFVKAGQIWVAGMQDLSKQFAAGAQANLDETMAAFKALSTAKTLKDAIDLQTGFARSAFEKSMSESGKLTDASMKLAEQVAAPITARVTAAMDVLVKAA